MGRPLKIQQLNNGIKTDAGFNQFANLDPGTQVIPVGMTSNEFLGVVGGANALNGTSIASSTFPVVAITANVNGQQGNAYIITQKGQTKYLVSGEDSVAANNLTQGFTYQITNTGNTNWAALGASVNATAGDIFTCKVPLGTGSGSGTASDCGQCILVASNTLSSGQMSMTFNTGGANVYATRLTNKYIWDNSTPPNRYAVNFFAPENSAAVANVNISSNAGVFTSNTYSGYTVGGTITVTGTLSNVATGSISGYTTGPSTYYIISTDGSSTFTLSATAGGANIVTTAGNTTGLTFTAEGASATTVKSGADKATWTGTSGPANTQNISLAQVSNYTS